MELFERWQKVKRRVENGSGSYWGRDNFWFNRRKNPFPCELCGEEIQSNAHICLDCATLALKGAEAALREQSQQASKVLVNCEVSVSNIPVEEARWEHDEGKFGSPYHWGIEKAIYALLAAFGVLQVHYEDSAQKLYENQVLRDRDGRRQGRCFFLTPDQFAALGYLAQAIRSHSAETARSAYSSGSSVLMRLAQGEVTTSEFDAARQRHGGE